MTVDRDPSKGFTLVELLVVISILAVLMALLLPAVQSARESARSLHCKNTLKQLSLAALNLEALHGRLPGDGWGWRWVGDGDRGFGAEQPGGWLFRLLPFTEASEVYDMPTDGLPHELTARQLDGAVRAIRTRLPWFQCPSRNNAQLSPLETSQWPYRNANPTDVSSTMSYVANWGDTAIEILPGPRTMSGPMPGDSPRGTGVIFWNSQVAMKQVVDGLSQTYLVGEYQWTFDPLGETSGENYFGVGTILTGGYISTAIHQPMQDVIGEAPRRLEELGRMGSAHPSSFNVSFCDGSVRALDYGIDIELHRRNANRRNGA